MKEFLLSMLDFHVITPIIFYIPISQNIKVQKRKVGRERERVRERERKREREREPNMKSEKIV